MSKKKSSKVTFNENERIEISGNVIGGDQTIVSVFGERLEGTVNDESIVEVLNELNKAITELDLDHNITHSMLAEISESIQLIRGSSPPKDTILKRLNSINEILKTSTNVATAYEKLAPLVQRAISFVEHVIP